MGQQGGTQQASRLLRVDFKSTDSVAILLIDAKIAFNSLTSGLAVKNVKKFCPSLYDSESNSYLEPSSLLLSNKQYLLKKVKLKFFSFAMSMYRIAIFPQIEIFVNCLTVQK